MILSTRDWIQSLVALARMVQGLRQKQGSVRDPKEKSLKGDSMRKLICLLALLWSSFALGADENENSCEIVIVVINIQDGFKNSYDADRFCDPFQDFCTTRRYGQNRYESSFRYRGSFFGDSRDNAWDKYYNFIVRNRFHHSGFNHSFKFRGGC